MENCKCGHSIKEHHTPTKRVGYCKAGKWDEEQKILMPCKCKHFEEAQKR